MDNKIALHREFCFMNYKKLWWIKLFSYVLRENTPQSPPPLIRPCFPVSCCDVTRVMTPNSHVLFQMLAKQRFCVLNILPLHEILAFVFSKSRITSCAFVNAPHLHIFIFSFSCPLFYSEGSRAQQPWEVSNTSQLSAISNSFAVFSPKRHKVRSEIKSPHLVLGRLLGGFPVSVASRIGFANIF